jgi:hypothetical protein
MTDGSSAVYQGDKVDLYSFGVMMWAVFACEMPFERTVRFKRLNLWGLRELIVRGGRPDLDHPRVVCAPLGAGRLMEQCWDADPSRRPSGFDEVQQRLAVVIDSVEAREVGSIKSVENPLNEKETFSFSADEDTAVVHFKGGSSKASV